METFLSILLSIITLFALMYACISFLGGTVYLCIKFIKHLNGKDIDLKEIMFAIGLILSGGIMSIILLWLASII